MGGCDICNIYFKTDVRGVAQRQESVAEKVGVKKNVGALGQNKKRQAQYHRMVLLRPIPSPQQRQEAYDKRGQVHIDIEGKQIAAVEDNKHHEQTCAKCE